MSSTFSKVLLKWWYPGVWWLKWKECTSSICNRPNMHVLNTFPLLLQDIFDYFEYSRLQNRFCSTFINLGFFSRPYTPNVCRDLQGLCRGFLQYLQGKSCNIYRFSLQFLQSVNIAGKTCKYCRIFPADIAENPCRVPVNPCKHLQCGSCVPSFPSISWLNHSNIFSWKWVLEP